jgi:pimeloyl-ACP methyl ester carboxylesterase
MKIKANGISMNYEIKGKGGNLVLIHGAGDNLNMWYHQVPAFSKNYRLITYDVRGSGKTESPKGDYSISLFANDVYELMRGIKVEDAYFLGYSMGGRVALELALNHPEMVKALILANSSFGLIPPSPEAVERRRVMVELLDKGDINRFAEMMITAAFSPNFKSQNPIEFKKYMCVKLQNKPDGLTRLMRALGAPTSPPDLSKVKCPALLIAGENDQYMGIDQAKQARERIIGSKIVILPTGHAAAIEMPDKFNAVVFEFLFGVSSR